MQALRMDFRGRYVVLAMIVLVYVGFASADTWLEIDESGTAVFRPVQSPAATLYTNAEVPSLSVDRSDWAGLSVTAWTPGLLLRRHENEVGQFVEATWPDAATHGAVGTPAFPVIRRLLVAPAGSNVSYTYELGKANTIELAKAGMPPWLLSVQPPIEKVPGAFENARFALNEEVYSANVELPGQPVVLTEVGLVRGQRLWQLEIRPVSHNPAAGTLTLYPEISVDISFDGAFIPPDALAPLPGLRGNVLNPETLPIVTTRDGENYLIVVASAYQTTIQPFAAAKSNQGFAVTTWVSPSASATTIKDHIQGLWGTPNAPEYILLVGDTDTIPEWTGGGSGSPDTDLPYVCMDGSGDWHPDIAIGRFPVRNTSQLQTIIDKTLLYENGPLPDPEYLNRAVFMASNDNYTVSEGTHNYVIDNYMTPNGIVSDKLYCHTYSATTQQVRDAFNDGRFWGVFSGHGGTTSWADGPPFNQSDVNNLTNYGMYPVVYSFACVTGSYALNECFTETWIRADNKGAIAIYGSSVSSYWTEDDILEKRLFDSIFDDGDDVPARVSPVWNDTLMRYLAEMGSGSTTRRYFEMYNLMGDPALPFFGPEIPPHGIDVAPEDELLAEGQPGGPFAPDTIVYTLKNMSEEPIDYQVAKSADWVTITNAAGTLLQYETAIITVSINENAETLPIGRHVDTLQFINETDHDGDTTRMVLVKVGTPVSLMTWTLDSDPGWDREHEWAFGQPSGQGGGTWGNPDPTSGSTGTNVFGVNLNGNYAIVLGGPHYLTMGPLDLSNVSETSVRFQRWLNSDFQPWVSALVEVSNDGADWTEVWSNGEDEITDDSWSQQSCDIWQVADRQPTVYVRWGYRIHRLDAEAYSGWNIDDVEIWGLAPLSPVCRGDGNCDGVITWRDVDYFVAALDSQAAWEDMFAPDAPSCPFENNDVNDDGTVSWRDIDPLVELMNTVCE
ncbi:MAG: hypothetical protein KAY37_13075 [Phycisphaerae bacterium]|nr:hypothetical protein [Phycisphaerae bacterium]